MSYLPPACLVYCTLAGTDGRGHSSACMHAMRAGTAGGPLRQRQAEVCRRAKQRLLCSVADRVGRCLGGLGTSRHQPASGKADRTAVERAVTASRNHRPSAGLAHRKRDGAQRCGSVGGAGPKCVARALMFQQMSLQTAALRSTSTTLGNLAIGGGGVKTTISG